MWEIIHKNFLAQINSISTAWMSKSKIYFDNELLDPNIHLHFKFDGNQSRNNVVSTGKYFANTSYHRYA